MIPDLGDSIGPARLVATTVDAVESVLAQVSLVPPLTWGRRPRGSREMWNSNSAVAWILASAGLLSNGVDQHDGPTLLDGPTPDDVLAPHDGHLSHDTLLPPNGGRAPGWDVGMRIAVAAGNES